MGDLLALGLFELFSNCTSASSGFTTCTAARKIWAGVVGFSVSLAISSAGVAVFLLARQHGVNAAGRPWV